MADEGALPDAIGEYRVEGVLGEGGMGRVYLAHDPGLDRKVAIKVLLPDLARDEDMTKRFLREARAMAKLQSPHVVTVYQVGEGAGAPFMVMELLDGEDLGVRLKKSALPLREVVRIAEGATKGLAAADAMGIVHRDVKPGNVFVCSDVVKLTDFGLARQVDGSSDLTQAGIIVGSPHYLAPELARGKRADRASDIYALGATLFECCAGRVPYPATTAVDAVTAHIVEPTPDLSALAPDVPLKLAELVTRMLAKDPAERPQSYDVVLASLDDILREVPPSLSDEQPSTSAGDPAPTQQLPIDHVPGVSATTPVTSGVMPAGVTASSAGLRASGPMPAVKTKTLTVMFTDIAGYTERTGAQSREEAARWLQLHDELLRPVIRAYRGDVVKTIGDALLVTFSSPTDAVLCGTAIQDRLFLHNSAASDAEEIHVRVAISAGEVRVHKGDVLGEPVNLAARLEKLAEAGEVVLSDAVYSTMNMAEVRLASRGTHQLKGIQREVAVYAAVPDGVPGAPPFGGRTLPSLEGADALQWVRGAGSVAVEAAGHVAKDASSVITRLFTNARRDPRALSLVLGLAGVTVVVVVVAMLWAVGGSGPLSRIDKGEAAAVLAELEQKPEAERSAEDLLVMGHALAKLDRRDDALRRYGQAAAKGSRDERALLVALTALEDKEADDAMDLLASWPDDDLDKRLEKLLKEESWWPRHHAADLLKERGKESLVDEQALAIKDLETGNACSSRRFGLLRLKRVARDESALDAVKAASSRMPDNLCMSLDLTPVEREIRKKIR